MLPIPMFIYIVAVVVLTVVCGLLLHSIVRFRRTAMVDSKFRDPALLEALWALVPVAILIALLIFTYYQL